MNPHVSIVRCESYDLQEVKRRLAEAMTLCPPPEVSGKTVLLKPNILMDFPPEYAITTHPSVLQAAAELFRDLGARVLAGDSPGLHTGSFSAEQCGLKKAAGLAGAEWIDFSLEKTVIRVPKAKRVKRFTVTRCVEEADIIVSLPKMKTHTLMYYTGAMKNLFGLIPGTGKTPFHVRYPGRETFGEALVDLNVGIGASYALMDGITGLEGAGPGKGGKPRSIGILMASENLLAMDIIASGLMGYDPMDIPTNREALSRGIWLTSMEDIVVRGVSPSEIDLSDFATVPVAKHRNSVIDYLFTNLSLTRAFKNRPKPSFVHGDCIRCGKCIQICPAEALSFSPNGGKKKVILDARRCVRCYCCHEICPVGAISVEDSR